MNRLAALLILGLALSPAAFSQMHQKTVEEQRLERISAFAETQREELDALERETARAMQLNNSAFFRRVYSDDFIGTPYYGAVMSKAALVNAIETSQTKYTSFVATDIRIRIFQDTAVVTCLWSARGSYRGQNFSRQSRAQHIYVNSPRGWTVVAFQETALSGQGQ